MFIYYNANPKKNRVGDCVIRAISKATGMDWEKTYTEIVLKGYEMYDMPSSNAVWGTYLTQHGFTRNQLPYTCPDCYSIKQFCEDYPKGNYIVGTGTHVVAVLDGRYYDTWDSGDEIPAYYFKKEEE